MTNTLVDFWSMIWDYKVRVLIMLTNLEENGRKKCEMYWPSLEESTKRYGPYTVTAAGEATTAFYVVRTFTVSASMSAGAGGLMTLGKTNEEGGKPEVRQVVQYLYSDWPDHGRPDVTVPLLRFVMKSSRLFEEEFAGRTTESPYLFSVQIYDLMLLVSLLSRLIDGINIVQRINHF